MEVFNIIDLEIHGDNRGSLISVESFTEYCPFEIKRVYYIFDTKCDVVRGEHAHRNLKQLVICISGNCDFILDNGVEREIIKLNTPSKAILIKDMVWREMTSFSDNCVLMVIASDFYNTNDYIYDYGEYLREVKKLKGEKV